MVLASWLAGAGSARARAGNVFDREPLLYAFGDFGIGTPLGIGGVGVGVAASALLALELGAGVNLYGLQLGSMASLRGRLGRRVTLGIAAGASTGAFAVSQPGLLHLLDENVAHFVKRWPWVLWVNLELQVRWSLSNYFVLRPHFGIAAPIALTQATCRNDTSASELSLSETAAACAAESLSVVPYLGVALEFAP